jgi:hypothetical protein
MSFDARCPQCVFVSRQIGQSTPCLLHVSLTVPSECPVPNGADEATEASQDYDEPYVFGRVRPTVDRPGPFTLREYVRLALLRSRVQDERRSRVDGDVPMLVRGLSL